MSARTLLLRSALITTLVVSTTLLAGCADDSTEDGTTTSTAAPTSESSTTTTTTVSTTAASSVALVGHWVGDGAELFESNMANLGGSEGMTCAGDVWMTFNPDGNFERGGEVSCGAGSAVAVANIESTGTYSVTGDQLSLDNVLSTGTLSVAGNEMPVPDSLGDGVATVDVTGDVLTMTFTDETVGTVTHVYTRVDG